MTVRVRVCGRLEVEWDGERLEGALAGRQSRALVAYLTLHRERPVRRDELVDALWAGEAPANGDALLRPVLSKVRRALGPERLQGREELALSFPTDTWVDWEGAQAGLQRARERRSAGEHAAAWEAARAALDIVERGLLPGFEAAWLERFRGELEELRCELLETVALTGIHLGDGDVVVAEQAARRVVELSPFRESARAALIEVLRRRGNRAEALVAYEEVRQLMRDELGSLPGPELRALHTALLDDQEAPAEPVVSTGAGAPAGDRTLPDRLAQAAAATWVGRGPVLARLQDRAAEVAAGAPGLVFVTGDGGIGKTRLVAELASTLPAFDVLYGRCDEEQQFPYGPWIEALRPRLAQVPDGELAPLLGVGAADLARLLPEIRERLPDIASSPDHGGPETERHQLFVAITQTVSRLAARRPLLVVIDDLHWADRSSLLLLRHVADEPGRGAVLTIGTFRDTELPPGHPLPALIADLERHHEVQRIALAGMDEDEVGALIGSVHDAEVEPTTMRAIRTETDGNPFFVKQLVRHLEEVGGEDGLGPFDELTVPQSVRDVIVRRVSRLPTDAGPVLRVAALLGRDFEFGLLAEVVELDEDALLDVLDAAVRGGLLVEVASTPGRYSFAHALLRTTLVAELSRTRRARLHGRIGAVIERRHAGRLEPWLEELARHFGAAGPAESGRAVEYAVRAAEQATLRLAYDESVRLLRHAVAAARGADETGPAELAGLEHALATAEARAGEGDASRASFARSADAASAAGDDDAFVRAALGHSGGTWEHSGREDAVSARLLEEALDRLDPADGSSRVLVLARLAVIRYYSDVPDEDVIGPAFGALAMARRVGDREALAAALVAALFARWGPGRALERLGIADELVGVAEGAALHVQAAEAHLWRALSLLELCRLEEADAALARHAEIAEELSQHQLLVHRDALRASRALLVGDFEAGAAALQALLARGERERAQSRAPSTLTAGFHAAASVSILHERDELGRFVPELERMEREMGLLPAWRAALAWAYVQAGRAEEARAAIDELTADDLRIFPRDANYMPTLAALSHAVGELGDGTLAARIEPQLLPYRDLWVITGVGAGTNGPIAYHLGVIQLAQRRGDDAVASFELALERSRAMRARPYVAHTQAGLAGALRLRGAPGDAERAVELEEQARDAARELGMLRLERELAGAVG